MSAEKTKKVTFVSLKLCFLGFVHLHNELSFSYLWSFIHKFINSEDMQIQADEVRTPTHGLIIIKILLTIYMQLGCYKGIDVNTDC